MKDRRMKQRRIRAGLALVALAATSACGNRVGDERIAAASYLDGTETEVVAGSGGTAPGGAAPGGPDTATDAGATAAGSVATGTGSGGGTGGGATGGSGGGTVGGATTTTVAGGGAAPAAGAAAGPATGSEVSIGVLGTFTGPVGVYVQDFATGVQVWGRWVNDNGGLNGHRVRVVVGDDGGSPAGFNSRAQQMVEQEGVIAMAFTTLGLAPGGNNAYLDSVGVPTFGTEGGGNNPYENPNVLTAVPSGDLYAQAMMYGYDRAAPDVERLAILSCSDFGICDNFDREWSSPAMEQATGIHIVYRARPSLTTPDFTSICIDARDAGAQGILNGLDTASINRLADACARQGYFPVIGLADLLGRPELARNPNADGAIVGTRNAAWFDGRAPGIAVMQDAFARYAPGVELNGTLAGGWLAAQFLRAAAVNLPADNPTAADLVAGLADLDGTDLGGMTYPLQFTPGQPSPRRVCFSAAVVSGGTFVPGPGDPLSCA
ncbi:MAG: ABC transporter substrate-binding protein [Acidimicrobiia bacterium]|nr:ABC transporter substrate-binding protein [Acidimicrobiia bacterium]